MQQRLLKQLDITAVKEEELLRLSRTLAQNSVDRTSLNARLITSKELRDKQEELKRALSKEIETTQKIYYAHVAEDEKLRKELSDDLAAQIANLNARMQTDVEGRGNALEENARLKEQMKILEENTGTTGPKFEELCATREKETAGIQERLAKEIEQEKMLREKIVEQKKLLGPAEAAYNEVKELVDAYVAKFSKIQENLQSANKVYAKSRDEQERMVKKIHATEKEALDATKRAERSKQDFDQETQVMTRFENQLSSLEAQTLKLKTLTATLQGKPLPAQGKHVDPTATA